MICYISCTVYIQLLILLICALFVFFIFATHLKFLPLILHLEVSLRNQVAVQRKTELTL